MSAQSGLPQDGDAYWRAGREFVRLLVAELDHALKASWIPAPVRRRVCTRFAFGLCNFLDHGWLKPGGRTRYPLLCFAKTFFDVGVPLDPSRIDYPDKSVELHGMVHDEVAWYFDEAKGDRDAVPSGEVGGETPDVEVEEPQRATLPQPCWVCRGTGRCFCLRKGSGDPTGCVRCGGSGRCRHCGGSGESRHP